MSPVFAQTSTDLPAPYGPIVAWGAGSIVFGLFGYLFLSGKWVSERERLRESQRADRAETQRDELQKMLLTETVPVLTDIQRTMVPTLERLTAEVARANERSERVHERTERLAAEVARMSDQIDRLERQSAGN